MIQYQNNNLRSDATYLPLFSFFPYLLNVRFPLRISKLYFHIIFVLTGYIVSIRTIYYDFINEHSIAFCMQLKEKKSEYYNSNNNLGFWGLKGLNANKKIYQGKVCKTEERCVCL